MQSADGGGGFCAATAVGKKTLLTAAHCFNHGNVEVFLVDGKPATIKKKIDDTNDHLFLLLDGIEFNAVAVLEPNKLAVKDSVYIYGNPELMGLNYRQGYVSELIRDKDECEYGCWLYQLPIGSGDSGGAVFKDGRVVAVITGEIGFDNSTFKTAFSTLLIFTPEQIKEAVTYGR